MGRLGNGGSKMADPAGKRGLQDGGSPRQPSPRRRPSLRPPGHHQETEVSTQELPNWELSIRGFSHPMTSIPYLIWTQAYVLPQPHKRTLPTPSQRDFPDSLHPPWVVEPSRGWPGPRVLAIKFISRIHLPCSLFSYHRRWEQLYNKFPWMRDRREMPEVLLDSKSKSKHWWLGFCFWRLTRTKNMPCNWNHIHWSELGPGGELTS